MSSGNGHQAKHHFGHFSGLGTFIGAGHLIPRDRNLAMQQARSQRSTWTILIMSRWSNGPAIAAVVRLIMRRQPRPVAGVGHAVALAFAWHDLRVVNTGLAGLWRWALRPSNRTVAMPFGNEGLQHCGTTL